MNSEDIIEISPYEVKFLIHRDRDAPRFKLLKEAIREIGVRQPLHVRDISDWPAKDRRRDDGGLYKWEALFGEGRTTACIQLHKETKDSRFLKLPAIIKDIPEGEIAGRFLAENILRRSHTWLHQAELVKGDVDAAIATKQTPDIKKIAMAHFIDPQHAAKLLRILNDASPRIARHLKGLNLKQAESLTSLPAKGQEIVLETLTESSLDKSQVEAVVRRAKRVAEESGELSKPALKASLKRVHEDLERIRERLKLYRLHYSLGPENLKLLLSDKKFRVEMDRHKINYTKFTEEVK